MNKITAIDDSLAIVPRLQKNQSDLQQFIGKYDPSKFKELKNGIEVRGVYDLHGAMNKARELIIDLSMGLEVVHNAEMAAYKAFEVREVVL
jgi:hypothetical protein